MARAYKKRKRVLRPIFAGKRSVKQRMWDFMRRNRKFKMNDIVTLLDLKVNTVRTLLYNLELAGIVRREKKGVFRDAVFTFLAKEEITEAPIITHKEVYCTTTQRSIKIEAYGLLKEALKEKSQGQLAKELEVDKSTLNLVLHRKYPNPKHIYEKAKERLC